MKEIIFGLILFLIYVSIAIGKYPIFRMNRATIALISAALLIIIGAISLSQAYAAIDENTILWLFSMMIINANLHVCSFFALVGKKVLHFVKTPNQLLILMIFTSEILSAFF